MFHPDVDRVESFLRHLQKFFEEGHHLILQNSFQFQGMFGLKNRVNKFGEMFHSKNRKIREIQIFGIGKFGKSRYSGNRNFFSRLPLVSGVMNQTQQKAKTQTPPKKTKTYSPMAE